MNDKTNQGTEKHFYNRKTEETMRRFYNSLNEKDRRRYAGVEALKIGHGGYGYIADVLGCNRRTVSKGVNEVAKLPKKKQFFGFAKEVVGVNLIRRITEKLTRSFSWS